MIQHDVKPGQNAFAYLLPQLVRHVPSLSEEGDHEHNRVRLAGPCCLPVDSAWSHRANMTRKVVTGSKARARLLQRPRSYAASDDRLSRQSRSDGAMGPGIRRNEDPGELRDGDELARRFCGRRYRHLSGEIKLIATGFADAAIAVKSAVEYMRPGEKVSLNFSSVAGLPKTAQQLAAVRTSN